MRRSLGIANEEAREAWRQQARQLDREQFVIIDACGSNIALTPLYARVPKGQRAVGTAPRNYGKNTTLIASLSLTGMGEALILEGSADSCAFEEVPRSACLSSLRFSF